MSQKQTKSHRNLGLHLDGQDPVYLRVPTLWDAVELQWIGFVQLPVSKRLIRAAGQSSFELEGNFNIEFSKVLHDPEYAEEIFNMFKPNEAWEKEEIQT
jgi:hypothetical protein